MDCYSEIDVDMHPIWICLCGTPKCWKGKFVGKDFGHRVENDHYLCHRQPSTYLQRSMREGSREPPLWRHCKRELVGNGKSILGVE
nr:hypothetical protein Iba_chr01eCG5460 [Ipomoea batatas]